MTETTRRPPKRDAVPLIDPLQSPEIFAHEAPFFSIGAGTVTVTLTSARWDNSVSPAVRSRVVTARIVMPMAGAQNLCVGLFNFLRDNGFDPAKRPDPAQVQ